MCDILSGVLFYSLLGAAVFLALVFYSLDRAGEFSADVMINVQNAVMYVCICFVYSYYAENIYDKTSNLSNVMYATSWYNMPIDIQRIVIFIIMQSQREFCFHCYGIYTVSLANFSLVCDKMRAYFRLCHFCLSREMCLFLSFRLYDHRYHIIWWFVDWNKQKRTMKQCTIDCLFLNGMVKCIGKPRNSIFALFQSIKWVVTDESLQCQAIARLSIAKTPIYFHFQANV